MSPNLTTESDPYVLATGAPAARRLHMLHKVCAPSGQRLLRRAGVKSGARVADFGCGIGATTRMLAEMVGPEGEVTGIDMSAGQLEQAAAVCADYKNVDFVERDACDTRLPAESFDFAYCRFLLMHLPDPTAGLREMCRVLRPGGILIVEDGDLLSAGSAPRSALDAFAGYFARLGEVRGLDYRFGNRLHRAVASAGFFHVQIRFYQPTLRRGEERMLLPWTIEEARPALLAAGIRSIDLDRMLLDMRCAALDPGLRAVGPRIAQAHAQKV